MKNEIYSVLLSKGTDNRKRECENYKITNVEAQKRRKKMKVVK